MVIKPKLKTLTWEMILPMFNSDKSISLLTNHAIRTFRINSLYLSSILSQEKHFGRLFVFRILDKNVSLESGIADAMSSILFLCERKYLMHEVVHCLSFEASRKCVIIKLDSS